MWKMCVCVFVCTKNMCDLAECILIHRQTKRDVNVNECSIMPFQIYNLQLTYFYHY